MSIAPKRWIPFSLLPKDGHLVAFNGDDVLLLHVVLQSVSLDIATTVENTTVDAHPEVALRTTHWKTKRQRAIRKWAKINYQIDHLPEHCNVFSSRPSLMKGLLILVIPTRWGQSMLELVHWYWPPRQTLISWGYDDDGDASQSVHRRVVFCQVVSRPG